MRNENCKRNLLSPEEDASLALSPEPAIAEEVIKGVFEPLTPVIKNFGKTMLDAYELAEEKVRSEHPHWFIEYPAKKKTDSDRRRKMMSRQKKRHHAIQDEIRSILGKSQSDMLMETAEEFKVILGTADEETEVHYLEQALERDNPEI